MGGLAVKNPFPVLSPLHDNVLSPLLLMVSVLDALAPTATLPNARLPESPMMRVSAGAGVAPV